MESKIPLVLVRQGIIEKTNIFSDNCELVDSKSVILFGGDKPVEIEEIFNNSFKIIIKITMEKKEGDEQALQLNVDPATNTIEYRCFNFDNPLGTGTSKPIEIGTIENKKIYIHFWIYAMGSDNSKIRRLEYSIWKER